MGWQRERRVQPIPILKADRLLELSEIFDQSYHPTLLIDFYDNRVGPSGLLANIRIVVNEDVWFHRGEERQPTHLVVGGGALKHLLGSHADGRRRECLTQLFETGLDVVGPVPICLGLPCKTANAQTSRSAVDEDLFQLCHCPLIDRRKTSTTTQV